MNYDFLFIKYENVSRLKKIICFSNQICSFGNRKAVWWEHEHDEGFESDLSLRRDNGEDKE